MNLKNYYNKSYDDRMKQDYRVQYANRILKLLSKFKSPCKLLELGCYDGTFLRLAEKKGYDTYGIDINPKCGGDVKRVMKKEITDLMFYPKKYFGAIIGFNILEHVRIPAETLIGCNRILEEEGLLFLSVPNSDTIIDRKGIISKEHINYFSYNTLTCLLNRCGFEVVWWKTRLITVILFKLFRKNKNVVGKAFNVNNPSALHDLTYKFIESLDIGSRGQDLMIVARKRL